ncbi:MAG: ABC-F family ATP-binding cassette domain-containing protein [Candidatus Xenobia bacterium]
MITVCDLSKQYSGRPLLDEVSLTLTPGQRIGLVGRNGCGKTTLLKILAGQIEADSGTVTRGPGTHVGYLGQEGQLSLERTLYEEMLEVFAGVFAREQEMRALEIQMAQAEGDELEALLARYSECQVEWEHGEGHTVDARVRTVLAGMGFRPTDLDRPCREFSGGWQMRGAMARLLLSAPTLLLLDEPTNHLDVGAVEWLESYLADYPGTVVLVSHDRYFLDRAVNRILELDRGDLDDYAGNYSFYLEEKVRRREAQQAAYENQQKKLEQDQRFIDRFRYKATLASRVKSREKMLERMERVDAPEEEAGSIRISFKPAASSGRMALVGKGLEKRYGDIHVLRGVELKVERDERIALVGPNGAGKSTLLRLLAGVEAADAGSVNAGFRMTPVYFAQHQAEALNAELTVLEEVASAAPPDADQTQIRTLLGCLLFSGEDVQKPVGVLSGGEKSRVALARCIATPSNFLFLDEPTNHLDIRAREALLGALQRYEGTIIFISHDRAFMDGLATQIAEFRDGQIEMHLGNYSDYKARREAEARRQAQLDAAKAHAASRNGKKAYKPLGKAEPRPVEWTLEALEKKIIALEEEIKTVQAAMADPDLYRNPQAAQETTDRFHALTAECEALTAKWEELA